MKVPQTAQAEAKARREANALVQVAKIDDPAGLRKMIANAERLDVPSVRDAAFRRLAAIQAEGEEGSVEFDFWRTIHAFEEALRDERGKAVKLTKTRAKIKRVGEVAALADFPVAPDAASGFEMLIARGMPEMTGEAIILRHPDAFDSETRINATKRLEEAGIDIAALPAA